MFPFGLLADIKQAAVCDALVNHSQGYNRYSNEGYPASSFHLEDWKSAVSEGKLSVNQKKEKLTDAR
jgi:hypothetical protein